MKIIVHHTWFRNEYNKDTITSSVILSDVGESKKQVTQAIRDWAKSWSGKGYILVSSIETTFRDDYKHCDIAQKKFNFNDGAA